MEKLSAEATKVLWAEKPKKGAKQNPQRTKFLSTVVEFVQARESITISPDDAMVFQRPKGSAKEPYGRDELLHVALARVRKSLNEAGLKANTWIARNKISIDGAGYTKSNGSVGGNA